MEKRIFENCDDYWITDDGRVYSYKSGKRKELSQVGISDGYRYKAVRLKMVDKSKFFYVHRLVAEAFIPNPNSLPQVNHKDRNPENNRVENLEWCTPSENQIHKYQTDEYKECLVCKERIWSKKRWLCKKCQKNIIEKAEAILSQENKYIENPKTIQNLTDRQREVLTLISKGYSQRDIARKLEMSKSNVGRLLKYCLI